MWHDVSQHLSIHLNLPLRVFFAIILCTLQVLQDFPHSTSNLSFQYIFDLIPILQPRAFSIASSMQVSLILT